jgi:phospholipid/cholesterol/gamma-HCH transport system ATP-binding protein
MTKDESIIVVKNVQAGFGKKAVLKDVTFSVNRGEILAIVGGSGSGKTTLLRQLMALNKPDAGSIHVFDTDLTKADTETLLKIQTRWGVLFQQNALFSSLTILENVAFPLIEHTDIDQKTINALAALKIALAGLNSDDANQYPSELSGGMQKRAGIARAIVMDPELIFLDEPTAGLDPDTAARFDELILDLQRTMGLTIVMVTHDLDSLWRVADRVAFLGEGKILGLDNMSNLIKNTHPLIQTFFAGPRGRTVQHNYDEK